MTMDVLDLLETKLSSFTKTDRAIYERLKKFPHEFAHESYDELTNALDVSPSALTRFAKKLGFSGYGELQYQLAIDLDNRAQRTSEETLAQVFGSFLVEAERTVEKEALDELAQRIAAASKVTCLGYNLSSISARFLWASLRTLGSIDSLCPSFDFMARPYTNEEVIVLFSVASGEWYRSFLQSMRKRGPSEQAYVALVTMNQKHSLRRLCDSVIVLPTAGKVSSNHASALEVMLFTQFSDCLTEEVRKTLKATPRMSSRVTDF